MFLKAINLYGFKSFAEKYEILMTDRITGIVGPNGSGKSNIGDAVRWVLGEQSAKSLRGDKMEDVIFNGTQQRQKKTFCEVSLLFENVSGKVMPDCSEIEVARRLYRSGESEYYINRKISRLKDILELFRDTGIGREGYSIIGQGKIEEILNEKSVARRRVFEEASGIMKYRVRKEEAERKLLRTEQNIIRMQDISEELETQLEPLRRQSEDAKNFFNLRERQKHLDVNIFLYNYDKGTEKKQKLNLDLSAVSEEMRLKKEELENLDEAYLKTSSQIEEYDSAIADLNEKINIFQGKINNAMSELKLYGVKKENLENTCERLKNETEKAKTSIDEIFSEIERYTKEIKELKELVVICEKEKNELQTQIDEASKDIGSSDKDIEEAQAALFNLLNDLSAINSGIAGFSSTLKGLNTKKQELALQLESTDKDFIFQENARDELLQNIEKVKTSKQQTLDKANILTLKIKEYQEQAAKLGEMQKICEKKANDAKARSMALNELINSFEGYFDGVKALLKLKEQQNPLGKKVLNTVAGAFSTEEKFELAIETALGAALQNVIVKSDYDAKELIGFLRKNDLGKATFLPLNSLKVRYFNSDEKRYFNLKGVLGVASELVNCDKEYSTAIEFLLARTVITDNLETAVELARRSDQSLRIVTLLGDIVNPGGSMTGGSVKNKRSISLISRERLSKNAEEIYDKENNNLKTITGESEEIKNAIARTTAVREQDFSAVHESDIELAALNEKLSAYNALLLNREQIKENINQAIEKCENEIFKLSLQIDKLTIKRDAINSLHLEKTLHIKRLEQEYSQTSNTTEDLKAKLNQLNVELASRKKDIELRHQNLVRLNNERQELLKKSETYQNEIVSANESLGSMEGQKTLHEQEIIENNAKLDTSKLRLINITNEKITLREQISDKTLFVNKLNGEVNSLCEKQLRLELNIERIDEEANAHQNRLWEEYELTYANTLKYKEQISINSAKDELANIREQIRNLGAINPNAIEDYERVLTRYNNLATQKDDLSKAKDDLNEIIASLLKKMEETFVKQFNLINQNFKDAFSELFGGGSASLSLSDKSNIMESGIEIAAEPPGKKLQSISLLSGGEKAMTAIALLFAMQKINPSPVCILDEIDAPLDDVNLSKYLEYIKRYSKSVQFVLITHRKLSMAVCNALYGIAMEEKGVSKILSVKLD